MIGGLIIKPEGITNVDWEILKEKYENNMENVLKKLEDNYPVQYLIGNVDFCDTKIEINENVLIPRFETEYLVEKVLKRLEKYNKEKLEIIDIGTGSGCIAISLAKKLHHKIDAIDISEKALKVAENNAKSNKVNINFYKLDILNEQINNIYDVIISNPPYVDKLEEVGISTKYEPQNAIFADDNGLIFYKRILSIIKNKPKLIAFEIGMTQGTIILKLAKEKFPEAKVSIEKDLTGRERYIFIEHI